MAQKRFAGFVALSLSFGIGSVCLAEQKSFDGDEKSAVPSGRGLGPGGTRLTAPSVEPPARPVDSRPADNRENSSPGERSFDSRRVPQMHTEPTREERAQQARGERARRATGLNNEAVELMKKSSYREAVSKLEEAIGFNADEIVIRRNLAHAEGEFAFSEGSYERAVERIKTAIALGRADLGNRLKEIRLVQEKLHDVKLAREYRAIIERDKTVHEPPSPRVSSPDKKIDEKWDAIKKSLLEGAVLSDTPGMGVISKVETAEEARGILGRFTVGIYNRVMGAVADYLHGDARGAESRLSGIEGTAGKYRRETTQLMEEEVAYAAGQDASKASQWWWLRRFDK